MTTFELEQIAYKYLWKQGTYLCFEVMMPQPNGEHWMQPLERVDLLSYETKGYWRFYELKISKSDFHSACKKTFLGHFNYFIMPNELYVQVANEIPKEIGVYAAFKGTYGYSLSCVKKPIKQELKVNHDYLMFNFMQALSREYKKYRHSLRVGQWEYQRAYGKEWWRCNLCWEEVSPDKCNHKLPKFCPNCGAKMKGILRVNQYYFPFNAKVPKKYGFDKIPNEEEIEYG